MNCFWMGHLVLLRTRKVWFMIASEFTVKKQHWGNYQHLTISVKQINDHITQGAHSDPAELHLVTGCFETLINLWHVVSQLSEMSGKITASVSSATIIQYGINQLHRSLLHHLKVNMWRILHLRRLLFRFRFLVSMQRYKNTILQVYYSKSTLILSASLWISSKLK